MASLNCKRFIIDCPWEKPVMTDDSAVVAEALRSDEHTVFDTVDGTYFDGSVWQKLGEAK